MANIWELVHNMNLIDIFCWQVSGEMVQIICMLRCLNDDNFYWPGTDDILQYHNMTDVIGDIDPQEANGKFYRGELVFYVQTTHWKWWRKHWRKNFKTVLFLILS